MLQGTLIAAADQAVAVGEEQLRQEARGLLRGPAPSGLLTWGRASNPMDYRR